MALFGTAGIRGPLDRISPELGMRVGMAFATHLGGRGRVVVARDGRVTGPVLHQAVTSGLLAGGLDVLEAGLVPTPLLAFATRSCGADGGVMVTASHNPPSDNGIKLFAADGSELHRTAERRIEELVEGGRATLARWDGLGAVSRASSVAEGYIDRLLGSVGPARGLKVVLDCANGVGAFVAPRILRRMGCRVVTMNSQLDGFFPGRPAEPTPENISDCTKLVRATGADLGLALDGDADRVAVVDENGAIVQDDALIALFSRIILEERGGGTVVTSINTSRSVQETVEAAGGRLARVRLGALHEGVQETGAVFAGEPWKLIFPDFGPWIDGIYCASRVAALASEKGPLSSLVATVPRYPLIRRNVAVPDGSQGAIMAHVRTRLMAELSAEAEGVLDIDGLRIDTRDGWVLVRASGTEPKVRVVAEGRNERVADEYLSRAMSLVEEAASRLGSRRIG